MKFDLLILAVLALCGALGYAAGALTELPAWLGIAAAYLATRPATSAVKPIAVKQLAWPPALVGLIVSSVFFFLFSLLGSVVARFALRKLFGDRQHGPADRACGSAVGVGKGAIMSYALLSAMLFFEAPQSKPARKFEAVAKDSKSVAFVRGHNLFAYLHAPTPADLRKEFGLDARAASPALAGDPQVKALLNRFL